jgi:hypothetical protein
MTTNSLQSQAFRFRKADVALCPYTYTYSLPIKIILNMVQNS